MHYTAKNDCKNDNFQSTSFDCFLIFAPKKLIVGTCIRKKCTHNLGFEQKKKKETEKSVYPCKPQLNYIKLSGM